MGGRDRPEGWVEYGRQGATGLRVLDLRRGEGRPGFTSGACIWSIIMVTGRTRDRKLRRDAVESFLDLPHVFAAASLRVSLSEGGK